MDPIRIVALMEEGCHLPRICEEGAKALLALTYKGEKECSECVAAGALGRLVDALTRHKEEEGVCVQAGGALANIAFYPVHRPAAIAASVMAPLAAAYSRHEAAQKYTKIALDELGYYHTGAAIPGLPAPHSAMPVAQIVSLMRQGADNRRVCEEGAKALLAVTYKGEAQCSEAVAAGCIAVLVDVLRVHMAHGETCNQACGALANICFYGTKNHADVLAEGAVALLVAVHTRHQTCKKYAKSEWGGRGARARARTHTHTHTFSLPALSHPVPLATHTQIHPLLLRSHTG